MLTSSFEYLSYGRVSDLSDFTGHVEVNWNVIRGLINWSIKINCPHAVIKSTFGHTEGLKKKLIF